MNEERLQHTIEGGGDFVGWLLGEMGDVIVLG